MGNVWAGLWLRLFLVLTPSAAVAQEIPSFEDHQPWWKSMVLYQIYPRSFKDSDGDGVGDLKGITQKATYLKELGMDAVALLPINPSPMVDFGFDISNFKDIDPIFGTLEDFDNLVTKFRELGIKLVVDFVPNHTSDEHPWFKKSVKKDPDFKDFYIWMDPKIGPDGARLPPNNWLSPFGGQAWGWNEDRHQYYLHLFHKKMPDLNYRNPAVVGNMTDVLKFWLDRGVDGFSMSSEEFLFKDSEFPDALPTPGTLGDTYWTQSHIYYLNQPETFALLKQWADVVYDRVQQDGKDRVVMMEAYNEMASNFYGTGKESLEMPFCFYLMWHVNQGSRPIQYMQIIEDWMSRVPEGHVATWTVGNHDSKRIPDRFGSEMVDAINLLTGVLPGIKITYYGEEIGMSDTFIRWEQTVDPAGRMMGPQLYMVEGGSRDPARTPMQWDNTTSAGFSRSTKTWLPVNPNYWWLNVEAQRKADKSHLKVFQAMVEARKDPVLRKGSYKVSIPDRDTLVVIRSLKDTHLILVINMGSEFITYTSHQDMSIIIASTNSGYNSGQHFKQGSLSLDLRPKAAVLLRSGPPTSTSSSSSSSPRQVVLSASLAAVIISLLFCRV